MFFCVYFHFAIKVVISIESVYNFLSLDTTPRFVSLKGISDVMQCFQEERRPMLG